MGVGALQWWLGGRSDITESVRHPSYSEVQRRRHVIVAGMLAQVSSSTTLTGLGLSTNSD